MPNSAKRPTQPVEKVSLRLFFQALAIRPVRVKQPLEGRPLSCGRLAIKRRQFSAFNDATTAYGLAL